MTAPAAILFDFGGTLDADGVAWKERFAAIAREEDLAPTPEAIDSTAAGFEKPDPRIFQAALSALGAAPDRAIFIGDSLPRDMEGARRLGMRHVYLKPDATAACCPGDAVIASLAELPEAIS